MCILSRLDLLDENWEYLDCSSQDNSLQLETNQSIDGGVLSNRRGSVYIFEKPVVKVLSIYYCTLQRYSITIYNSRLLLVFLQYLYKLLLNRIPHYVQGMNVFVEKGSSTIESSRNNLSCVFSSVNCEAMISYHQHNYCDTLIMSTW